MTRCRLSALSAVAMSLCCTLAAAQGDGSASAPVDPAAAAAIDPATAGTQPADAQVDSAAPVDKAPVTHAGPQLLTEDLRRGAGDTASSGKILTVHYTGWLYEPNALGYRGKKFDSSHDRGQPFQFMLGAGRVIKGWEVGIVGMQVGGLRRLVIPPEMAYGSRGVGNGLIPPDATLVFEIDLLGIESSSFEQGKK